MHPFNCQTIIFHSWYILEIELYVNWFIWQLHDKFLCSVTVYHPWLIRWRTWVSRCARWHQLIVSIWALESTDDVVRIVSHTDRVILKFKMVPFHTLLETSPMLQLYIFQYTLHNMICDCNFTKQQICILINISLKIFHKCSFEGIFEQKVRFGTDNGLLSNYHSNDDPLY